MCSRDCLLESSAFAPTHSRFAVISCKLMRPLFIPALLSLTLLATAAPKKAVKAVPAVPAVPSKPDETAAAKTSPTLINSDLSGRDVSFIAHAMDLGRALRYLATQTPRTTNPTLRGFGDDLVRTMAAQSAVLNTVAEMRQMKVPGGQSATERRIADKIAALDGIPLEKAILDAFLAVDAQVITAYEVGVTSQDQTIRKFAEQTLPQVREHLVLVEAMAGISQGRPAAFKPVFRTRVGLPSEPASVPDPADANF